MHALQRIRPNGHGSARRTPGERAGRRFPGWAGGDAAADLRLRVPARAESVGLVRHALAGLTGPLRLDVELAANLRLAVTEACTNVVRHAYPEGEEGPLDVRVTTEQGDLEVAVRDRGPGIAPRARSDSLGLGLPLIAALSDGLRIFRDRDGFTVLAMRFARDVASAKGAA
jgi:serine/threonine-protein kinase RsbW